MSGFSLTTAQYLVETLATVAFALSGVIEAARRGGIGAFRGQRNPDWIIGGGAPLVAVVSLTRMRDKPELTQRPQLDFHKVLNEGLGNPATCADQQGNR